ncbi:MAG: sensor histidine kinase [Micropepsaceae bacterium]
MSLVPFNEPGPPRPGLYERFRVWLDPDGPWLWLIYLPIYGITWFWVKPSSEDLIISLCALPIFLILYVKGHATVKAGPEGLGWIGGILVLAFTLGTSTTGNWSVIAVYAFALAGAQRPRSLAIYTIAGIALAIVAFSLLAHFHYSLWLTALFFGFIVAVANLFSSELAAKNAALIASQSEVRIMAAAAERERIARDLHDLLGHTLTVVAVKADLAARLVDVDPVRAKVEMQDLQSTARTALADIRSAVTGMRRVALGAELAQARNALAAVDTTLAITGPDATLPALVEETLAMLLREGATNVVRHARASRCEVVIDVEPHEVRFTLSDDGVGGAIREGNGLAGMRARVAAVGGTLHVEGGQKGSSGTRIEAVLPIRSAA